MKCNNKGFSLVELIIVIAMMVVLVSAVGYGVSLASSKDVEQCAQSMMSSIQHCRTVTMGKNMTTITISYDGDGTVIATENVTKVKDDRTLDISSSSTKKVGKKGLQVKYNLSGGGDVLLSTTPLTLEFDRGCGALLKTNGSETNLCTTITISDNNTTKTIVITPLTGKVEKVD